MTEKKEYPKEKLYSEVLIYQGKTLKRQGKKEDKEWKSWQLLFQKGKFGFKCGSFDPLTPKSLQIKDLVEGQYYEIVYKLRGYDNQYGHQESKEVVLLKPSTEDKSTENVFQPKAPKQKEAVATATPLQSWQDFSNEYATAMKDNPLKSSMHMLGAYIANHHSDQFAEIIAKCKGEFKK